VTDERKCWDCCTTFAPGTGYGDDDLFCSKACADSFRVELGA
jgi:hypothetical protein